MRITTLDIIGHLNLDFAGPALHRLLPGVWLQPSPIWSHAPGHPPHQRQRDLAKIQIDSAHLLAALRPFSGPYSTNALPAPLGPEPSLPCELLIVSYPPALFLIIRKQNALLRPQSFSIRPTSQDECEDSMA